MTTNRRDLVLRVLRDARGRWVDAHQLCAPDVGGLSGLRRLRELRADGHPIEHRQVPGPSGTVSQYRLLSAEPQQEPLGLDLGTTTPPARRAWQSEPGARA